MTRRQICARAIDPTHKRLMLAWRNARGGEKAKALRDLRAYMTEKLKDAQ
jgi:hypothetical protein